VSLEGGGKRERTDSTRCAEVTHEGPGASMTSLALQTRPLTCAGNAPQNQRSNDDGLERITDLAINKARICITLIINLSKLFCAFGVFANNMFHYTFI